MYNVRPNLLIGFHGCDEETCYKLLHQPDQIIISRRPYEWLGHGMYFWENNFKRAWQWAQHKEHLGHIKKAAVVGAILHLRNCFDLLDSKYIGILRDHYQSWANFQRILNLPLITNTSPAGSIKKDKVVRSLDCAVIEFMHKLILWEHRQQPHTQLFNSVRGVFTEGKRIYKNAGFYDKSHIQICIRNPNCILGFFHPRKEVNFNDYLDLIKY